MFKLIITIIWAILGGAGGMYIAEHYLHVLPGVGGIVGLVLAIVLKFMLED